MLFHASLLCISLLFVCAHTVLLIDPSLYFTFLLIVWWNIVVCLQLWTCHVNVVLTFEKCIDSFTSLFSFLLLVGAWGFFLSSLDCSWRLLVGSYCFCTYVDVFMATLCSHVHVIPPCSLTSWVQIFEIFNFVLFIVSE